MKTQISNLINGSKNVIRMEEHPKYENAHRATSHIGFAGTNSGVRNEVAAAVYKENGDLLKVNIRGIEVELDIYRSVSGKSWMWTAELSEEQFKTICRSSLGTSKDLNRYLLVIQGDCTVQVQVSHRQNERQTWKAGYTYTLDEAFVTIL